MLEITIVAIGEVQAELIDYLSLLVSTNFGVRCASRDNQIDYRQAYNPNRRQYDSTRILGELLKVVDPGSKVLGVTNVDLFVPIFTFVFGSAQVGGSASLISTCRLRQQFYGLPEDQNLFLLRCEKEALHELGHTFGLVHCPSYECVMHFSNSIEQVDLKGSNLCDACVAKKNHPICPEVCHSF